MTDSPSSNDGHPAAGSPAPTASTPRPAPRRRISPLALVLGLSAAFFVIFLMVSGAVFVFRGSGSSKPSHSSLFASAGGGSVGVVELTGVIMDSKRTISRLRHLEEDDRIKAVVLRLDSPGGSVAPSQEIYEAVRAFKKPLVVSMGSIAASGAFYVACAAKKVFANPGTITGSIGVIMEFANLEKLYDWAKIKRFSIKTGRYKDAGAEYREMQPDERALLQGMIDNVLTQFKSAVATGRKLSMETVTSIADGRVMSGEQAKSAKLVDELGTFQDAIDEAGREGKIKGKPEVSYPEVRRHRWLDLIMDGGGDSSDDDSTYRGSAVSADSALVGRLGLALQTLLFGERAGSLAGTTAHSALESMPGIYWIWNGPR